MSESPEASLADHDAVAFLAAFLAARATGDEPPLSHWLQRFPRSQGRIAAEWLRLQDAPPASVPEVPADPSPPGYRLLRELGRGGQGIVYLAHDQRLDRQVALKVLTADLQAFDAERELRFRREIAAIAKLDHPSLCTIFEAGDDARGRWLAMKFVDGPSLQQQLAAARTAGTPPPRTRDAIAATALLVERLADGLHQAHAQGLVHRDIKPGNVLLGSDGTPVLVDFGMARTVDHGAAVTMPGAVVGTPSYLAPELLRDQPASPSSDVWSLGAVLFELLTHERPFPAATIEAELRARATADAVRDARTVNPAVPRDLAVIAATALAQDPARRYASAADLAADLRRFRTLQPILARPASTLLVLRRWLQRNPALATSLAALAGVLMLGLLVALVLLRDTRQALADVRRLADLKACAELTTRAAALWPLRPARLAGPDGLHAWLGDTDAVLARRSEHAAALARLPQQDAGTATPWQQEQLQNLLAALEGLAALRTGVAARAEFAATIERRSLQEPGELWQRSIAAIAASPAYRGLQLAPQLGLVPLGPDPDSGLHEFAHLQSGTAPHRDPQTGRLQIDEASGIVLVLLPGGEALLGAEAQPPADGHPANVDPGALSGDGPCYRVALEPFFLARYEVTQAQWLRHTGRNPSNYNPDSDINGPPIGLRNPVEQIDWVTADRVMKELDLQLPTEAQWEYAYRAGAAEQFPWGDDMRGLQDRENLADADGNRLNGGNQDWAIEDWLHDGHSVHAPVGSFRPNRHGLHDLGGNLREWCADSWENFDETPPRAGDGFRFGRFEKYRVVRGGCFTSAGPSARCAQRSGVPIRIATSEIGVRAARAVQR